MPRLEHNPVEHKTPGQALMQEMRIRMLYQEQCRSQHRRTIHVAPLKDPAGVIPACAADEPLKQLLHVSQPLVPPPRNQVPVILNRQSLKIESAVLVEPVTHLVPFLPNERIPQFPDIGIALLRHQETVHVHTPAMVGLRITLRNHGSFQHICLYPVPEKELSHLISSFLLV